ncbi:hypothetical protein K469DRAFT_222196 [Zopfia rhizophila CBS 207.26]|uniref:Zn(2)-C6 fungal-type domain-containing protein n=1 Tax=Zopfia rhizophila CBS 207.26 TaxID=1314779 RepID=A0A6A6DZ10_9PEZI|nr:hypothetical protein K469DRAFT_222196 [Zopfia rhizophila CBS 207.26]
MIARESSMQAESKKSTLRRASTQRSRTGCFTCRRRRVKCDETHPHCQRCLKANVHCEGYAYSLPSKASLTSTTSNERRYRTIILPKVNAAPQLSNARLTGILLNETEVENRYLRYFQQETTCGFESTWDWTLWNRLVLQGSHHEPFIRYAVVAIGALHKSLRMSSPTGEESYTKTAQPMAKIHRDFAYLMYGKAVNKMQSAIEASSGPRHALIACLLIICFETHVGNRYRAATHALYGLQILQQWVVRNKLEHPEKPSVQSPSPAVVEDEIVEAFKNLDIQISTVSDGRTLETHRRLMEEDSHLVEWMPERFEHLNQARSYWNLVMRRTCHFIATTWSQTECASLAREFETKIPGSVIVTMGDTIHTTSWKVEDSLRTEQKRFSTEISLWLKAFDPLFLSTRRTGTASLRACVIATMLRIQALAAQITISGVLFTQEVLYDTFHPEFQEIVHLAGEIATARQRNSNFDFWGGSFLLDLGLVVPLFLVLLRCRDSLLRRQSIKILKSWQVECWWDPLMIAAIGQFMMEVEEQGMVDGFIPESSRAVLTAKSHCPPQRVFLVQCVQRTGGEDGGPVWTEKFITW